MREDQQSQATIGQTGEHPYDARLFGVALKILTPLARLAVSAGVRLPQLEELLKRALLQAGQDELERAGIRINKSRLSISTGVHRKDVKRLLESEMTSLASVGSPSAASLLYTHWSASPELRDGDKPVVLPYRLHHSRPSFEALARQFTTDAHPRTLLDEMVRLDLVSVDPDTDQVTLLEKGFVPDQKGQEMLDLLGTNVGDHLATAVSNVLGLAPPRLEQALFEQYLSEESAAALERRSRRLWHEFMAGLVPMMNELSALDKAQGRKTDQRIRIGMYAHWEPIETPGTKTDAPADDAPHGRRGEE